MQELKRQFADPATLETRARRVVEGMALCLQGSLLVRNAPPAVADAFCASRLGGDGGLEYGTLPAGSDFEAIIERSLVEQVAGRASAVCRAGAVGAQALVDGAQVIAGQLAWMQMLVEEARGLSADRFAR